MSARIPVCMNCMAMERERDHARGELGRARFRADNDVAALRAALDEKERHLAGAIESADKSNDAWNEMRAAHEALLRRTQSLETALDQERAACERLRAFAQSSLYVAQSGRGDMGLLVEYHRHGLLDDKGSPTALLSGRGEGR